MSTAKDVPVSVHDATTTPWETDPAGAGKVHLSLTLNRETDDLLDDLARRIHGSKGDVLRKAVGLFKIALDSHEEGKRVGAVEGGKELDTEFVGF
ncbi:MAG: hypothetical protein U0835_06545 [Isosphaeraceae bacterium]